jgi:MULE transposase domain
MTTKKQGLYAKVIDVFVNTIESATGQKPQPDNIMSDYELAILSTMALAFPNAQIRGCWFHYAQVGF